MGGMMLSKQQFYNGMKFLNSIYLNWKFDLKDGAALRAWYSKFINLNNKNFETLIKWYSDNHDYPPTSAVQLLNSYKEIFKSQYPNEQQIHDELIEWLSKFDLSPQGYEKAMRLAPTYIWQLNNGKGISYYKYCRLCDIGYEKEINELIKLILANQHKQIENDCYGFLAGLIDLPIIEEKSVKQIELDNNISDEEVVKQIESIDL